MTEILWRASVQSRGKGRVKPPFALTSLRTLSLPHRMQLEIDGDGGRKQRCAKAGWCLAAPAKGSMASEKILTHGGRMDLFSFFPQSLLFDGILHFIVH